MVKLLITSGALYFVFTKIEFNDFKKSILSVNLGYFILAFLAFNFSKFFAALRILEYLKAIGISISHWYNLKLNYVGMYYNLFLPGSIGGDGYKIFILSQIFKDVKTRLLIAASLLDRINGVALLFFLTCILLISGDVVGSIEYAMWLTMAGVMLALPGLYIFTRIFFRSFLEKFNVSSFYSLVVQLGQLATAYLLLLAIGVEGSYYNYLVLFMVSSVVAVIPLTIGGVGARELVFLYGNQYLEIDQEQAISFTLLFFMITCLSALIGLVFSFNIEKHETKGCNNS